MLSKRVAVIVLLVAAPLLVAAVAGPPTTETVVPADDLRRSEGLTVHEWGTFTSVAGPDGKAMVWQPAGGPTDLPCFVALTDPSNSKVVGRGPANLLGGREGVGTVRMETPVLYFYSPQETTVNVRVSFPHGLITEWYPSTYATVAPNSRDAIKDLSSARGTIQWNNVKVMPGARESFPMEPGTSHYYQARRTGSDPLQVGNQQEKFLFYRGIASFQPPIAAQLSADGAIQVTNLGAEPLPAVVLFENRGGKMGFTVVRKFEQQTTMQLPELNSSYDSLRESLEGILRAQGMYAAEAAAMVDTWKYSWFEQGTRLFYIVPSRTVDALLPLTIDPQPAHVARAFVGRLEVITPATQNEVLTAFRTNNRRILEKYGRFIEPITKSFYSELSEAEWSAASSSIASIRAGYVAGVTACTKDKGSW